MAIDRGIYAADGSFRVSVVDGSTFTGLHAADGSFNVVLSNGTLGGLYHPCGAYRVTVAPTGQQVGIQAPDGSMYVAESPYNPSGAVNVTVVSGSLHPSGTGFLPFGLLTTYFG